MASKVSASGILKFGSKSVGDTNASSVTVGDVATVAGVGLFGKEELLLPKEELNREDEPHALFHQDYALLRETPEESDTCSVNSLSQAMS